MRSYEHRHIVSFEETNLVGNVYYVNHIRWQGHCREMFLRDHAPGILQQIEQGKLALVTIKCSCEYFAELHAFDELLIRMTLGDMLQNRITMYFDYFKIKDGQQQAVAKGMQEVGCMEKQESGLVPVEVPGELISSLLPYQMG